MMFVITIKLVYLHHRNNDNVIIDIKVIRSLTY